jgi:hypothetical protein
MALRAYAQDDTFGAPLFSTLGAAVTAAPLRARLNQ